VFGIDGYPGAKPIEDKLWQHAVALLPEHDVEAYTQGLMDLGATLCTRSKPSCPTCPLAQRCVALATGRVHQLPVRKEKKAIPQKHTAMLVITDREQVLLEQRPDSGIWGGLLSLPEVDEMTDPGVDLQQKIDARVAHAVAPFGVPASCERLQPFSHGFTHFKLHVSPYRIRLARRLDIAGQLNHVWYGTDKLIDAPLPAPVKKLLLAVFQRQDLLSGID
jgi:A/G-specific adenine glycosylase